MRRSFLSPLGRVGPLSLLIGMCVTGMRGVVAFAADPVEGVGNSTHLTLDPFKNNAGAPNAAGDDIVLGQEAATGFDPSRVPTLSLLDATTQAAPVDAADKPSLTFELPIWLPGIYGKAGARGTTATLNASFLDILNATDSLLGLGGRVEADYGSWIFSGDGIYMRLAKDNISERRATLTFLTELAIADVDIMYQFGKWDLGSGNENFTPVLRAAGGVGARYMHVGLHLDTPRGLSRNRTEDWADPSPGRSSSTSISTGNLWPGGDIGVGPDTDLTCPPSGYLSYQFNITSNVSAALKLGYQAISEEYQNGSDNRQFVWDAILHGPVFVFAIQF